MKYGEAHTAVKLSLHMKNGKFITTTMPKHEPKMSKEDAVKYYNARCREVFESLGYKYKIKEDVADYKKEGFNKVSDYFDYYEALKYSCVA